MESARGFLLLALGLITFVMYQQWQTDYAPKPEQVQQSQQSQSAPTETSGLPVEESAPRATQNQTPNNDIPSESAFVKSGETITLDNNVVSLVIDEHGDVVEATLKQFAAEKDTPSQKVKIFQTTDSRVYQARVLFSRSAEMTTEVPDQSNRPRVSFEIVQSNVVATEQSPAFVELKWTNPDNITFTKRIELPEDSYSANFNYEVNNQSDTTLTGRTYLELKRNEYQSSQSSGFGIQAFEGAAYSWFDSLYEKYDFEDFSENLNVKTEAGWIAFLQHYFVSAWIPDQESENSIYSKKLNADSTYLMGIKQPWQFIKPGQNVSIKSTLYVGPKDQENLEQLAKGLDLTVDYGFLWWIGQPIFWALSFFHSLVGNWGVAIIMVTILVKLILYPLANAQYRSFAKMRMLQPKLTQLKERYGDDRQKMSMAMMEMYKKEKVNPMGGCLPLLVQMPVFLALYWVLLESYEIRHAPFMLWIQDLSAKDPYYILPVLMGISMWAMQKLQPTSAAMDPMQQKIMQYLPVMMTVFFVFFPAGLVLYWLVNNLLSIAQQLYITNKIEKEYNQKKKA